MQSLRLLRRKYQYQANPPRRSTESIDENKEGLSDEEREKEEEEIEQKRKERDPYYVTWESHDDPMNPQNWSTAKKWSVLVLVSMITLVVTFSSSVFSGATMVVSMNYGISLETAELGTGLYLIGFGIGPLFFGPLSEAFGRTPVYMVSFLGFLLSQLGPAVGQNIQAILICRFFSGFFGASPLSNAGGSVSDMFSALDRTLSFPFFAAVSMCCSMAGTNFLTYIADAFSRTCDRATRRWSLHRVGHFNAQPHH